MIILTGGPGVGKTSLAQYFETRGFRVFPESGRALLQENYQFNADDPAGFAMACAERDVSNWKEALSLAGEDNIASESFLFDRGLIDNAGYLKFLGQEIPAELDMLCKTFRYPDQIFSLPPWREIYERDDERHWNWEEAVATGECIAGAWRDYGYQSVDVPPGTIEERFEFIMKCRAD